jgi:hypothetical protein
MMPDTWDQLGWHHQRALLEGLEDEGLISRDGSGGGPVDLTSADDSELAGLGLSVESI